MSAISMYTSLVSLLTGAAFGLAFDRSQINNPAAVIGQFKFHYFIMIKMFLSAATTSIILLTVLENYYPTVNKNTLLFTKNYPRGLFSLIAGTSLLGLGLALTGSCPGTVYAQLGAGYSLSLYVFIGGLIGALFYGLLGSIFASKFSKLETSFNNWAPGKYTLFEYFGVSRAVASFSLAALLISVIYSIELYRPWRTDLQLLYPLKSLQLDHFNYIPPELAGVIVGSLQLPLITQLSQHLGTSSSYVTLCSNIFPLQSSEFTKLRANYWQVIMTLGIFLGAFLSSTMRGKDSISQQSPSVPANFTPFNTVLGGVLMIFGSRLAAGCTSGHGISGLGFLSINSLLGVAVMFGTAIAASALIY
jgi:uncharacterized membrane protein YedE/YeeE